jgi:ABC-type branched-subunit amino acid transport system substrate-binding protein
LALLVLAGCSGGSGYNTPWVYKSEAPAPAQSAPVSTAHIPAQPQTPPQMPGAFPQQNTLGTAPSAPAPQGDLPGVKVAILLPLSGPNATLGQSMLNAAQVALFDVGYNNFQLVPYDTGAGAAGGAQAAQTAINEGASLILGPLFADSVRAAKAVAARSNVNIVAFSTDWTLADNHTFLMGFLPFGQVERVVSYAAAHGLNKLGVLAPKDAYGEAALQSYQNASSRNAIQTVAQKVFIPGSQSLGDEIKAFAQYEKRASMGANGTIAVQPPPFNAVFIPAGDTTIRTVSNLMTQAGLPPETVKRLGTGLWDDPALASDKSLNGSWFAAPSPNLRRDFEQRYLSLHGSAPPRLATLAYDATALAAVLAQTGLQSSGTPAFDSTSITNPNGFAGIDGIFRFRQNGLVERGLAVLEFRNGQAVVIDEAPQSFEAAEGF